MAPRPSRAARRRSARRRASRRSARRGAERHRAQEVVPALARGARRGLRHASDSALACTATGSAVLEDLRVGWRFTATSCIIASTSTQSTAPARWRSGAPPPLRRSQQCHIEESAAERTRRRAARAPPRRGRSATPVLALIPSSSLSPARKTGSSGARAGGGAGAPAGAGSGAGSGPGSRLGLRRRLRVVPRRPLGRRVVPVGLARRRVDVLLPRTRAARPRRRCRPRRRRSSRSRRPTSCAPAPSSVFFVCTQRRPIFLFLLTGSPRARSMSNRS